MSRSVWVLMCMHCIRNVSVCAGMCEMCVLVLGLCVCACVKCVCWVCVCHVRKLFKVVVCE